MPGNTSGKPKKKQPKQPKQKNYQIRGVPDDLQARIAGAAGYLKRGKDEFVTELLRRSMRRFERQQKEVEDWWKAWEVLDSDKD